MNHTHSKRKGRKHGKGPRLSPLARKAISQLRRAPRETTAFSLYLTREGSQRAYRVIERGRGPDSSYYICEAKSGRVPKGLPAASTYLAATAAEVESLLAMFADHPEMWSRPSGDALDEAEIAEGEPDWETIEG